jgi:hypothetical protein
MLALFLAEHYHSIENPLEVQSETSRYSLREYQHGQAVNLRRDRDTLACIGTIYGMIVSTQSLLGLTPQPSL